MPQLHTQLSSSAPETAEAGRAAGVTALNGSRLSQPVGAHTPRWAAVRQHMVFSDLKTRWLTETRFSSLATICKQIQWKVRRQVHAPAQCLCSCNMQYAREFMRNAIFILAKHHHFQHKIKVIGSLLQSKTA